MEEYKKINTYVTYIHFIACGILAVFILNFINLFLFVTESKENDMIQNRQVYTCTLGIAIILSIVLSVCLSIFAMKIKYQIKLCLYNQKENKVEDYEIPRTNFYTLQKQKNTYPSKNSLHNYEDIDEPKSTNNKDEGYAKLKNNISQSENSLHNYEDIDAPKFTNIKAQKENRNPQQEEHLELYDEVSITMESLNIDSSSTRVGYMNWNQNESFTKITENVIQSPKINRKPQPLPKVLYSEKFIQDEMPDYDDVMIPEEGMKLINVKNMASKYSPNIEKHKEDSNSDCDYDYVKN